MTPTAEQAVKQTQPIGAEANASGGDRTDPAQSHAPVVADPVRVEVAEPPQDGRPRRSTRVIALMNQKGGVGKTTTVVNLGAALADAGQRVLLIDMDPQGHLTLHVGLDPHGLEHTVYDLLIDPAVSAGDVAQEVGSGLVVLPAETNLAGVESELAQATHGGSAQQVLRGKCRPLLDSARWFDYVLIDCPPSLGLLTINALTLADEVIVPMQPHFLALQGLSKLLETVQLVKQGFNPRLTVAGVVLCMHEGQTVLAKEIVADLEAFLADAKNTDMPWRDAVLYEPPIRRNIKLAECSSFGTSILDYAPTCPGAQDYRALAGALVAQGLRNGEVSGTR